MKREPATNTPSTGQYCIEGGFIILAAVVWLRIWKWIRRSAGCSSTRLSCWVARAEELKGTVEREDQGLYRPASAKVSENQGLIQAAKRVPKFGIPMYAYKRDANRGELYEYDI